jgi:sugar lactone lactonase YvrE
VVRHPWCVVLVAVACGDDPGTATAPLGGLAILGNESHSLAGVVVTEIGFASGDGLAKPTDLAFHPDHPDELWVVNQADESVTIFWNVGTAEQKSRVAKAATGEHFLAAPSGIAFGENGNFATIHDLNEPTQGGATPAEFMGPTLWTGDREIFEGGDVSHLDMLHNSPLGKGIAWDGPGNRYWVFDGLHESLTRYDFNDDHGLGGTDHTDGEIVRFVEGEMSPHGNLPSHLELDAETGTLYVADPGNARIATLDTTAGERGELVADNFDGVDQYEMVDVETSTFIDTAAFDIGTPVGIALRDGMVFVSSVDPSAIHAFDLQGGLVDWLALDREPNGIAFAEDGTLYFVSAKDDEVVRISPASG